MSSSRSSTWSAVTIRPSADQTMPLAGGPRRASRRTTDRAAVSMASASAFESAVSAEPPLVPCSISLLRAGASWDALRVRRTVRRPRRAPHQPLEQVATWPSGEVGSAPADHPNDLQLVAVTEQRLAEAVPLDDVAVALDGHDARVHADLFEERQQRRCALDVARLAIHGQLHGSGSHLVVLAISGACGAAPSARPRRLRPPAE